MTKVGANHPKILLTIRLHKHSPLGHQFLPVFFGFQTSHRSILLLRDHREDFDREPREHGFWIRAVHNLGQPLTLLRSNIRGRGDPMSRIDQEEYENLSVTGLGVVFQVEWLYHVLIQVRERDASMSLGDDVTYILYQRRMPETRSLNLRIVELWTLHAYRSIQ